MSGEVFLVGGMVGRRTAEKKRRKNLVLGSPNIETVIRIGKKKKNQTNNDKIKKKFILKESTSG